MYTYNVYIYMYTYNVYIHIDTQPFIYEKKHINNATREMTPEHGRASYSSFLVQESEYKAITYSNHRKTMGKP